MKVLLLGSNGQVGFLLKNLFDDSVDLLAPKRNELDISNQDLVNKIVNKFKPDIIVNAAAYTAVDKAEIEADSAFLVNSEGPKFLAKASYKNNAILIHLSTDYVFSGDIKGEYTELDEVSPKSIYGKTKLEGENAIEKYCEKYIILRTSWVFGEHGNNFVKTMLKLGLEKESLDIVNDQYGSPTYAGDIAKAIISIISTIENGTEIKWGLYNFSGKPYVNWYQFAQKIFLSAEKLDLIKKAPNLIPVTSANFSTAVERPKNSKLNCQKIAKEFGIFPSNWELELKNIINYIEQGQ